MDMKRGREGKRQIPPPFIQICLSAAEPESTSQNCHSASRWGKAWHLSALNYHSVWSHKCNSWNGPFHLQWVHPNNSNVSTNHYSGFNLSISISSILSLSFSLVPSRGVIVTRSLERCISSYSYAPLQSSSARTLACRPLILQSSSESSHSPSSHVFDDVYHIR